MNSSKITTRYAHSSAKDEVEAVRELAAALDASKAAAVLFFCSPRYDLDKLGAALKSSLPCPTTGCTSSGQIDPSGFKLGGISAVAIFASELTMKSYLMRDVMSSCASSAEEVAKEVTRDLAANPPGYRAFGLVLVDGLSRIEERLTAALYVSLGNVPIVGGSAGDDLAFERTYVYSDGAFISNAALFVTFATSLPFATFKFQHFVPTERKMLITGADPTNRTVHEIDGRPAAEAYAELIGVPVEKLDATTFSQNPIVLELDGEPYVRSIARKNDDGSLVFLCAIEEGMVVSIGGGVDVMTTLEKAFDAVQSRVADPALVIGCDCILRRLEFEQTGMTSAVGEFLAKNRVFGFSTYGEQFNGIHVNQTFTGVAIGG